MSQPSPAAAYYFHCTGCRRQILVTPNQAGSKVDCPCGTRNVVPALVYLSRLDAPAQGGSPFRSVSPPAAMHPSQRPLYPNQQPPPEYQPPPPCPFCRQPLQAGRIYGERYKLKWLAADTPLAMGIWAIGGLDIGHGGFMQFNRPHVFGWRCANCCKIIVDERA
jgi:hypothetical protein